MHSPGPNRQQQCDDELSPVIDITIVSPVILGIDADLRETRTVVQPASLSLPTTETFPRRPIVSRITNRSVMNESCHRTFQRPQEATAIFPSDLGVEVAAASCEVTAPIFQRRGRFLVWPASFGQEQGLNINRRA